MNASRGQAAIETLFVMPMCLVCAWALVECGVVVRDQLALSQAAARAGVAVIEGEAPEAAAAGSVPAPLRRSLEVDQVGRTVRVSARPRTRLLGAVAGGRLHAEVIVEVVEGDTP